MCFSLILNMLRDLPGIREATEPKRQAVIQINFLGDTLPRKTKNFTRGRSSQCLNRRNGIRDAIIGLFHTCLEGIVKIENTNRYSIMVDNHQGGYSEFFHPGNCNCGKLLFVTDCRISDKYIPK